MWGLSKKEQQGNFSNPPTKLAFTNPWEACFRRYRILATSAVPARSRYCARRNGDQRKNQRKNWILSAKSRRLRKQASNTRRFYCCNGSITEPNTGEPGFLRIAGSFEMSSGKYLAWQKKSSVCIHHLSLA